MKTIITMKNAFEADRTATREALKQSKADFDLIKETLYSTYEEGPKATVKALIDRIGYDRACAAIATMINSIGSWDERVSNRNRAWAQTIEGAFDNEAAHQYYMFCQVHSCHADQLADAMRQTERPTEPAEQAEQTAPDQAEATEAETSEAEQTDPEKQNVIEKARKSIEAKTERSAWGKGVTVYAIELLDSIEEAVNGGWFDYEDLGSDNLVNKCMLNGATDWKEFSWGGSSLIYDGDIAERLCNPSELKKTKNGTRRPNAREEWLDVQARALFQASIKVREAIKKAIIEEVA